MWERSARSGALLAGVVNYMLVAVNLVIAFLPAQFIENTVKRDE